MINYSNDVGYGWDRLGNTVATVAGQPAWISRVDCDDNTGDTYVLSHSLKHYVESMNPLEDLDPTPVHIGFVNDFKGSGQTDYISRNPFRQWKQGLRPQNLVNMSYGFRSVSTKDVDSISFKNSYLNIYPSVSLCAESITCGESESIAFHKEYKLHRWGDIIHIVNKTFSVGMYNINKINNGDITLTKEYAFLEDELEEILG